MPTIKVHRKCKNFGFLSSRCNLKGCKKNPWGDACADYDLRDIYVYDFNKVK